jgi:ligand-binding SRPBCC domain-containing protein
MCAKTYRLEQTQLIRRPRSEVFPFFADAANLEQITPAFLRFAITSPMPIEMKAGALIDYRLQLFGIPFNWQTKIESFEPPHRFTDLQVRGPYRLWHHTHEFHEVAEGTMCVDIVRYELPWGPLGRVAHPLLVKRSLDQIFAFRRLRLESLLAPAKAHSLR